MVRIFQVRLKRVDYQDLHQFFDFVRYSIPDRRDKYYVRTIIRGDGPEKIWYEAAEFGVHDLNHNMLGVFKLKNLSNATIISFYITENNYRQAFLEYIRSTIEDMKLTGFTIEDIHEFSEDTTIAEDDGKPYVPKTEAARERWREAYVIIQTMQDEAANSDDLEIYIPTLADFRDRIKEQLMQEYCEKTISQIRKAGDAGLLDE